MAEAGKAVILTYHSISHGPKPLCLAPDAFAKQMEWLRNNANVIPLSALHELLLRGGTFPARAVALTFDDGFEDFAAAAAPVLLRLKLPAMVFLPTAYCGSTASWDLRTANRALLTWDKIRDLRRQGFEFGSHSMTHPMLPRLSESELMEEIAGSKKAIQERLQYEPCFFCYPYGGFSERCRRIVAALYSGGACTTELRPLTSKADRYALPRIDVHYLRNFQIFRMFLKEQLPLYLDGRRLMRTLRARAMQALSIKYTPPATGTQAQKAHERLDRER